MLFDEARRLGLRILLDLVAGHTSTEHPWFKKPCKPARNRYSDWYIWTNSVWKWTLRLSARSGGVYQVREE